MKAKKLSPTALRKKYPETYAALDNLLNSKPLLESSANNVLSNLLNNIPESEDGNEPTIRFYPVDLCQSVKSGSGMFHVGQVVFDTRINEFDTIIALYPKILPDGTQMDDEYRGFINGVQCTDNLMTLEELRKVTNIPQRKEAE